jgi:tetraprenyl-beta-curcumene synthase
MARAGVALVLASARYWTGVAPLVKAELGRWEARASAIGDPALRALALDKLRNEGFTAEAAAMLATFAPRAHRSTVVEAIVALEIMYDYLDGLGERPSGDPLGEGQRLFQPFTGAFERGNGGDGNLHDVAGDDGYLDELAIAVRSSLARLPAAAAIAEGARVSARRSAQAQTHMHAAPALGRGQMEAWAKHEARWTVLGWRELLAGAASSVIGLHVLIAAAAQPETTTVDAAKLSETYLSIAALSTMLDSLIDRRGDISTGEGEFARYYETAELLADALIHVARQAAAQAARLADGAQHLMMLVAVVAYFTSDPRARSASVRPTVTRLHAELAPMIAPALGVMRAWRLAKWMRRRYTWSQPVNPVDQGSGFI